MNLSLLIISIFIISAPAFIAGRETRLSLPKRASLQQVLGFLQEIRKMMKENSPTYRLHNRDAGNQVAEDETIFYAVLNRLKRE